MACRDHVRHQLGYAAFTPGPTPQPAIKANTVASASENAERAAALWRRATPITGTIGENYLRNARGIRCVLPPTLRFIPPRAGHPPSVVSAYGIPTEPEPGALDVTGMAVRAVHITRLHSDGASNVGKIMLASPAGLPIVVSPWTDSLGLIVCEGVEDALSAHEATGLPAWAAGSAGHMAKLAPVIPDWTNCVVIVEDGDNAGRRATRDLVAALASRNIPVEIIRVEETVNGRK